jgi:DNA-binding MarR family transcriptional regulator
MPPGRIHRSGAATEAGRRRRRSAGTGRGCTIVCATYLLLKMRTGPRAGDLTAVTPEDLVIRLRALTREVQNLLAARAKELGLGTTDFLALIRTTTDEGVTGAQLAQAFRMRSSSVTSLADRLEAKGLVARRPHPTDRRTVVLRATRRGQSAVTSQIGPLLVQLQALAGEFDTDARATVAAFLDGINGELRGAGRQRAARRPRVRRGR